MADMYCESERDQTNDPVILPPTDIGSNNNDTDLPEVVNDYLGSSPPNLQ